MESSTDSPTALRAVHLRERKENHGCCVASSFVSVASVLTITLSDTSATVFPMVYSVGGADGQRHLSFQGHRCYSVSAVQNVLNPLV